MSSPPVAIGDVIDGKYRVDGVIGEGGMGIVVAATHLALDQKVAIKFLLASAAVVPEVVARFAREGRALAKIKSDHVARVMDVGTLFEGAPYLVMEHLEGSDLARVARRRGRIPHAEVAGWILQACDAIAEAHAAGIVHRDLKPANLFLAQRGGKSPQVQVKVLDFGISKTLDLEALTRTESVLGSPLYMAPEQAHASKDIDARTDIWALGVILYELTTGVNPFLSDSLAAIVTKIISVTPPPPRELVAEIPEAFSDAVMRCLAKTREERFPDVASLVAALSPGEVSGLASTQPQVALPSAARRRVPWMAGGLGVIAIGTLLLVLASRGHGEEPAALVPVASASSSPLPVVVAPPPSPPPAVTSAEVPAPPASSAPRVIVKPLNHAVAPAPPPSQSAPLPPPENGAIPPTGIH